MKAEASGVLLTSSLRPRFAGWLLRRILPAVLALLLALPLAALMGATAVSYAQITPWPVTLTITGPATAVSGQEITYRVHYRLTDPSIVSQTGFLFYIPQNTTYVSSQVVSGPSGVILRLTDRFVEWGSLGNAEETDGEVELTVKIDADFVGSTATQADEPGTLTAASDVLETQVLAPGRLPEAGGGAPAAGSGRPLAAALLALAGASLVCAGAAIRGQRRAR